MADKECNTDPQIIKITASDLRKGRRLLVCVVNDNIDENITKHIEMSNEEKNGDFWISFGWSK